MTKRLNNKRTTHNILSFDSSKYDNFIVNIVFAAEIEKCTHRPIMHMFDSIVSKNSSSLIAFCLSVPLEHQKKNVY